jgi:hypothetical protein
MMAMTFWDAEDLAQRAHEGQTDKLGVPYIEHVRAVALGVLQFGLEHGMAGLLHDIVEDCDVTLDGLRLARVPEPVVVAVGLLTKVKDERLQDYLERIADSPMSCRVKISDNAHNTLPERVSQLAGMVDPLVVERLERKYRVARTILWNGSVPHGEVREILKVVNPSLLPQLDAMEARGYPC